MRSYKDKIHTSCIVLLIFDNSRNISVVVVVATITIPNIYIHVLKN